MHNGGHLAAASCLDGCVRVWDTQDASKTIQQLQAAASENWGIDFAPIKEKAILAIAGGMTSSLSLYAIQDSIENVQTFKFPKVEQQLLLPIEMFADQRSTSTKPTLHLRFVDEICARRKTHHRNVR